MDGKKRFITLIVFLLGIFMGAIDTGIISPARIIIQNSFGVDQNIGIWMITIYSLAYAVSMPITSKLSDKFGRKKVYLISISIFTIGSVMCGLTDFYGNFYLLLISRVIQALGGGGILPIATAFIGQSFPPEKRGVALGMVGSVFGVATILGPTIGSSILDIAGPSGWGWLFFINLPIGILITILGFSLDENKEDNSKKLDLLGSGILTVVILSLMFALTNLKFFDFENSFKSLDVWPYFLIFIIFLPILVYVEMKVAEDPIINFKYFKNSQILLTMVLSFIVGCGLMGSVFTPQFAENVLKIAVGKGGYIVTIMAVFSGISAPLGGKFIDKYSAKFVLIIGFACTVIGMSIMSFYVSEHPSMGSLITGIAFVGLGLGFSIGTPLNYLILKLVPRGEASSAVSTLSLVRSIGIAISPNIMIGFLSQAGNKMMGNLMSVLPSMPRGNFVTTSLPPKVMENIKSADVTNITDRLKEFTGNLLGSKILPPIKAKVIEQIEKSRTLIENTFQSTLNYGFKHMFITAGVIAFVGLIFTLFLNKKSEFYYHHEGTSKQTIVEH